MNRLRKILNYYKVNYKVVLTHLLLIFSFFFVIYSFINYILDTQGSIISNFGLLGILASITHIAPSNINWYGKYRKNKQKINDIEFDISFEIKVAGQFDKLYRLYVSKNKVYLKNQFDFNNYDIEFDLDDIRKITVNGNRLEFNLKKYTHLHLKTIYSKQIKEYLDLKINKKSFENIHEYN